MDRHIDQAKRPSGADGDHPVAQIVHSDAKKLTSCTPKGDRQTEVVAPMPNWASYADSRLKQFCGRA
jgi:hypothetical protein